MTGRRAAYEILRRITQEGAYANLAIKEEFERSDDRPTDIGRTTALVYTVLEHMSWCDFLIEAYAKGRVHSSIRTVLRIALAEIFFMDTPDHAACDSAAKLTAEIGKASLKGFVNGVLRSIVRDRDAGRLPELPSDPVEKLRITSGFPAFIVKEYVEQYGEQRAESLLSAKVDGMTLRAVFPHDAEEVAAHLDAIGVPFEKSRIVPGALRIKGMNGDITEDELFKNGVMTVQSESAVLACRALDPKPGMDVLDACAAPGGKTAYLFDLMERKGSVTAWDIHPHRVKLIENTLARLNVSGVSASVRDASEYDPSLDSRFDAILLDVPCSGLGGGSGPDARYRRTEEGVKELARLQASILDTCSRYLKKGGSLVYSTCTLTTAEDEGVIAAFLAGHPGFSPAPVTGSVSEEINERGRGGMLRLFPDTDGTEGFFIAKLIRND